MNVGPVGFQNAFLLGNSRDDGQDRVFENPARIQILLGSFYSPRRSCPAIPGASVLVGRRDNELPANASRIPDKETLCSLAQNLPAVWNSPATDMRLKQRIVRILIEEIIADVDDRVADSLDRRGELPRKDVCGRAARDCGAPSLEKSQSAAHSSSRCQRRPGTESAGRALLRSAV